MAISLNLDRQKLATVSRDLGNFLWVPGLMATVSMPICIVTRDWPVLAALGITLLVVLGLASLFQQLGRQAVTGSMAQTLVSVAISWGVISIIGGLPLWLAAMLMGETASPTMAAFKDISSALFEGVSGFISAGLTMAKQPSQLPTSIQWWRSLMQWTGGVGIIAFAIALLDPVDNTYALYQAEGRQARIRLTVSATVKRIWLIYISYTIAGIILFRLLGMPWWEAVNHAMTAISTGGFSVTDDSIGSYSAPVKLGAMVLMICGAIAFSSHDRMIQQRRLSALWQDRQHRLLLILLAAGASLVGLEHYSSSGQFDWLDSSFQWVSALSTCGFSSESLQFWSDGNKLILSLAMIVGGAAGSTVGGIKLDRLLLLCKTVQWRFRNNTLSTRELMQRRLDGAAIKPRQALEQVEDAVSLVMLWLAALLLGVWGLNQVVSSEYGLSDTFFEVASALGAAGLSMGITQPSLPWVGKYLLMLLMWMGRLEIIPVLLLLNLCVSRLLLLTRKSGL